MKTNNKGQLGKIISTPIVLILVFLIMLIFLALTGFIKNKSSLEPVPITGNHKLLLQNINVQIDDKKTENILVFEGLARLYSRQIDHERLRDAMKSLVNSNNNCLLLAHGEINDPKEKPGDFPGGAAFNNFYIEFKNGKTDIGNPGALPDIFSDYRKAGYLEESSITVYDNENKKKEVFLEYYHGRCLSTEVKK